MTLTISEDVHWLFTSVQAKSYEPGMLTVTVASAWLAFGLKLAVPGPLTRLHVPVAGP